MDKMMNEFFENFTKILMAVKDEHIHKDPYTCTCGYQPTDGLDWSKHIADAQARKLIEYIWEK